MPGASIADATTMIQRLAQDIRGFIPVPSHPDLKITFSGGLTRILPDDTAELIYRHCDKALFEAKRNGRDCVKIDDGRHVPSSRARRSNKEAY